MQRSVRVALGLVAAAIVLGGVAPAGASHSWNGYHWARTTSSFTLQVGDNVSGPWEAALDRAVVDWNPSAVLDLREVPGSVSPKTCKPTAGRVEVCNAKYGRNGWLGLAQIWLSNGHIVQGTAKMNDTYFATAAYNSPTKRSHVMCQEIGHTFGLGHQDETGADLNTCMDYSSALDNPAPNAHDFQQLAAIYAHTDSYNSYTASTAAATGSAAPEGWGQAVGASHNGRADTYVLDLGDGDLLVTHVLWTEGHGDHG